MLFSTIGQGRIFLWMAASGILIGAWYAFLAAVRRLLDAGFWLSLIADIAFGAGAAVIFLAFLITANYGVMRLYPLLGAGVGIYLFAFGLFPLLKRLFLGLNSILCSVVSKLKQNRLIKVILR